MQKNHLQENIEMAKEKFANHIAQYWQIDGDKPIEILDWKDANGSKSYHVRYIFDKVGKTIVISGDLGAAVVKPTWEATLEKTIRIGIDPKYFLEKCEATSDNYTYYRSEAEEEARQYLEKIAVNDKTGFFTVITVDKFLSKLMSDFSIYDGFRPSTVLSDALSNIDPEWREWLYWCGKRVHPRVIMWLVGLQMAGGKVLGEGTKGK